MFGLKVRLEESLALPMLPTQVWQIIVAELPRTWGLDRSGAASHLGFGS